MNMNSTSLLIQIQVGQAIPLKTKRFTHVSRRMKKASRHSTVVASKPWPKETGMEKKSSNSVTGTGTGTDTVYKDSCFDLLAITYLSQCLQHTTGLWNEKHGYESLTQVAMMVSRSFDAERQQQLVIQSLHKAFPHFLLKMIKRLLPASKMMRELCAVFTVVFFAWLVGPSQVRESEMEGRREKNVVYIPKCRFVESTGCVGMCINMCKLPCQKFIHHSLGIPLYMLPNFEEMSCQIIFGEKPPLDDPTLNQPCYTTRCIAKQLHAVDCSTSTP